MKYFWSILIVLGFQLQILSAQPSKRANVWYFGYGVGVDFNQQPPKAVYGHKYYDPSEACGIICDTSGNMLLYTDGTSVWNRKDTVVFNGSNLDLKETSAQGALFIPQPENDSLVYLFQARGTYMDFGYTIININHNNGRGIVMKKNVNLFFTKPEEGEEKQVAINHANGRDVWVITHKVNTNEYYAYLVTDKGLVHCPVVSSTGSVTSSIGSEQGYLSISSDGQLLSNPFMVTSANNFNGMVDISKFNNQTGVVSNTIVVDGFKLLPFSTCFSPNGKKLYMDELEGYLYQMDLDEMVKDSIKKSIDTLIKVRTRYNESMYLAPNNKIYMNNGSVSNATHLSIIENPDAEGKNCNYSDTCSIRFVQGSRTGLGLPNFNRSYLYNPAIELYYEFDKVNNTLTLKPYDTFGNTVNGILSIKKVYSKDSMGFFTKNDTTLLFEDTGLYLMQYSISNGLSKSKVLDNRMFIRKDFLGKDTSYCPLSPLKHVLQAPKGMHCYQWSNGKSSDSIHVSKPGKYSVLLTLPSMLQVWDTIEVDTLTLAKPIDIIQKKDTLFALGGIPPFSWYKNAAFFKTTLVPYLKLDSNGTYVAMALDSFGCFPILDTFIVSNLKTRPTYLKPQFPILYYDNTWHIPSELSKSFFKLYDIKGSMLYMGQMEQLKNYSPPAGIIFLCISNSPYSKPYFQKLIIP